MEKNRIRRIKKKPNMFDDFCNVCQLNCLGKKVNVGAHDVAEAQLKVSLYCKNGLLSVVHWQSEQQHLWTLLKD